ncbi:helix-turn-helix domain-containing protein [Maribacter arcticus]|uniref:helix-turn-helix domain-containing protein n=1 Tax=Maribacter arcticus TaxID=561365 RepID=UPI0030036250
MESIQLLGISPEQLRTAISKDVESQLDDLKKHFQPKTPTEYLSRQEVAQMFKINLSTVHNWTKNGTLQAFQIGGRVFYKRELVENAIVKLNN